MQTAKSKSYRSEKLAEDLLICPFHHILKWEYRVHNLGLIGVQTSKSSKILYSTEVENCSGPSGPPLNTAI